MSGEGFELGEFAQCRRPGRAGELVQELDDFLGVRAIRVDSAYSA